MKLDDNIAAIVSGGASGLGAAVVRHLRDREVKTALFDKDEDAGCQIASDFLNRIKIDGFKANRTPPAGALGVHCHVCACQIV